jgi:hypothetical protein
MHREEQDRETQKYKKLDGKEGERPCQRYEDWLLECEKMASP